ncbi:MAG: flagellar hook-basal body complex protein [Planctomycetes bacterium]|nr:flagellar hook-basal body complex protein [Planctomycetota bacterium]
MGLTTSLYTSLSGMNASSQAISVAGNNIANVNTTAFKSSRADFQTQVSETIRVGSAPTATSGGTNPSQVGLGVQLGSITRNFNDGSLQPTGVNTEMAVEGDGFFVLSLNGSTRYTRDGSFKLDRDSNLVAPRNGGLVQGNGVDDNFNLITGTVGNINIPLGTLTIAERTHNVNFAGNLNANGIAAANGSVITSGQMFSDAGGTTPAVAGDNLASLFNSTGGQLFNDGDVLTLTGITKGSATLPDHTFQVGAANTTSSDANGSTLQDFMTFLQSVMGIDATVGSAGVTLNSGSLVVTGNTGSVNDLVLDDGNIIRNQSTTPTLPMTFSKSQSSDGESVRTTFVAFDSLGTPMNLDLSVVLESKDNTGTSWRFYAQSEDDTDVNRVLGNGTLAFDTNGQLISAGNNTVVVDRAGTGAFTPQSISLNFNNPSGALSALTDVTSQIAATSKDGTSIGTLQDFSVSSDGTISGVFSNSEIRTLGRVVVAKFANPAGLIETGNNLYNVSNASGDAAVVAPGTAGTGRIIGGALELSNVDLSQEFINLISASTGFTANSRVLTTSDRLIQELLSTLR